MSNTIVTTELIRFFLEKEVSKAGFAACRSWYRSRNLKVQNVFRFVALAQVNAIADTGLLVALTWGNDQYHKWAVEIGEQISWPVLTCEAVLAEAAFHLQSSEEDGDAFRIYRRNKREAIPLLTQPRK